ncbi:MAG: ABC transporter ATP-binding protein [Patescibacteria group bacterium]
MKLFKNIPHFLERMKVLFLDFRNEEYAHENKQLRREIAMSALSQVMIAFGTVWFILEVVNGRLQVGTFTFVLASIVDLRQSLSSLFHNVGRQYQDNLFVSDIFEFLDLKPALSYEELSIVLNPKKTPEIVFENVTFFYPNTGTAALKKFSLTIPPGGKFAFVGANGAGKTTVIKLLARFYDPTEGRILIDGKDLREIDLSSWYEQLGALFQDYVHYFFQVKESIGLGRTGSPLSMEKVRSAAVRSEADKFIEMWDKAYEQLLGHEFSEGVEPSIGQWQKLALARTFYRDPNVFILDEPTSSIDAESEAKIFEKLEKLPKDKTVILISHRFSTVRQADTIAVIEDGFLRELGMHNALLKKKGIYARLFKLQAKGYK